MPARRSSSSRARSRRCSVSPTACSSSPTAAAPHHPRNRNRRARRARPRHERNGRVSEQTSAPPRRAPTTTAPPEKSGNVVQRLLSGAAGRNLGLIIALVLIIVVGADHRRRPLHERRQLPHDHPLRLDHRRHQHRHDLRHHGGRHRPLGRLRHGPRDASSPRCRGCRRRPTRPAGCSWSPSRSPSAAAAGLVNGIVIAYGKVVPFMATLAMLVAARGLAELLSNKTTQIVTVTGLPRVLPRHLPRHPVARSGSSCIAAVGGWFLLAARHSVAARSRSAATSRPRASPASG